MSNLSINTAHAQYDTITNHIKSRSVEALVIITFGN